MEVNIVNEIEIFCAAHKQIESPLKLNPCYKYIHVGSAGKPILEDMVRDDQGDNISEKNPLYCELTALYWIWKHSTAKYKGLCHYRRYLAKHYFGKNSEKEIFTQKEVLAILAEYDLMLPTPKWRHHKNKYWHWYKDIADLEQDITYASIKKAICKLCPDYLAALNQVFMQDTMFFCNVIYGNVETVDSYCEWLFPILSEIEAVYIQTNGSVPPREIGYAGEYLLNVWVAHNANILKIYYTPLMRTDRKYGMRMFLSICAERMRVLPILDKICHKYFM